jgi:small subunit ribosomal protein S16
MPAMLKIRLQRVGRKNVPSFRLVLTDSQNSTKSGKFLEILGHFDYRGKGNKAGNSVKELKADRIKEVIANGAQVTASVHNLLLAEKVIEGKRINVLPRKAPPVKESKDAPAAAPAAATPAPAEAPKA